MRSPDPARSARALLPGMELLAAGVFGVQDRALAHGLLGVAAAEEAVAGLVQHPHRPETAGRGGQWAGWGGIGDRLPISVLLAVSPDHIHVCDWHHQRGAARELARFDRGVATLTLEEFSSARRLVILDPRTGYRLPLTATVSRLSPFGSGAREVLGQLVGAQHDSARAVE